MRSFDGSAWITALTAAFLVSLLGCKTTPESAPAQPEPVFSGSRLEVSDRSISSFTANVTATVENPRSTPLVLEGVSYTFAGRGRQLREGVHDLAVTVPPGETAKVGIPVAVEYSLAAEEGRAIFSGDSAVPLVFNGLVSGRYGQEEVLLELNRAGRMRSPRIPEVSLDTPDGARRRVDEVHATLRLQVSNDNPFEIRLASVDYVLEVEGHQLREARVGTRQRIPPSGVYVFTIEQDLRTENVPELETLMREENRIGYRFHGELRIGDLVIPFDESDEIRFAGQS